MRGDGGASRSQALFDEALSVAGTVRYLSLLSLLLHTWLNFQTQFVLTTSNFVWLGFHGVSAPVALLVTFLKRGADVAVYPLVVSAFGDFVLASTSLIMVVRCFDLHQASEACPTRMLEGSWLLFYGGSQFLLSLLEISSMTTYAELQKQQLEAWETRLRESPDEGSAKRLLDDAKDIRARRAAGVERRLCLFTLVPGIMVWLVAAPTEAGFLTTLACARPLRDVFGVWASYKSRDGNNNQRELYDTLTTVISALFLLLSLGAWMWSEELDLPVERFSATVLLDAAKSAYDDPFTFMRDTLAKHALARPEPFLFLFVYVEVLVLSNKNTPVRG